MMESQLLTERLYHKDTRSGDVHYTCVEPYSSNEYAWDSHDDDNEPGNERHFLGLLRCLRCQHPLEVCLPCYSTQ